MNAERIRDHAEAGRPKRLTDGHEDVTPFGECIEGALGFGFIEPDGGGKDAFVHISAVERAGLNDLREGQKVSYELATERGRSSAVNLKVEAA